MEATIDTLNIKVEGDGKSAESALDRVLKKLERIKEATRGTNGGGTASLNSHFNNLDKTLGSIKEKFRSVSQITDDLREKTCKCQQTSVAYADAMDSVKEKAEQSQGRFKTLSENIKEAFKTSRPAAFVSVLKTIGRLTLYRMIRSMIKQVTESFKTGIDDMYQYSKTINGEYARSMDQLASANLSYKNSIGAIMAPLINVVTPWIDSFVDKLIEINNTIAMVFAGLAGKSTYSKAVRVTTEYAEAANKASDNTGKVTEKVEELKRSLAGLDEITIIGQNLSPVSAAMGGNDAVSNGLDYGSMFVEAPVDMAKVNEIKEKFERILEIAKWIGLAIAAWELGKFLFGIGQAIAELGRLKAGITLLITGFTIEAIGGYHIGYGDAGVMDYVKLALGSALGVVGTAMVFGFTPAGWAIGIMAALTVGITSITVGMENRLADVVQQAFYDAGGTITISDLADQFERYCQAIVNANQPTIDAGTRLSDLRENEIGPTISSIGDIIQGIKDGALSAEENLPKIETQFKDLYNNTKSTWDDMYLAIVHSLAGGFGDTLTALGMDVPVLSRLLAGTTASVKTELDQIDTAFQELYDKLNEGTITNEQFESSIQPVLERFGEINGLSTSVTDSFDSIANALSSIDWQSAEDRDEAFTKIKEAGNAASDSVEDFYTNMDTMLKAYRDAAEDEDTKLLYSQMIAGNETYRNSQLADIKEKTAELYGQIQDDVILKMSNVADAVGDEWENNWWAQLWYTKDDYIAQGLKDYKRDTIDPIVSEMETLYKDLGFEGKTYASTAAEEVISGLFDRHLATRWNAGNIYSSTGNSFEDAVRGAYEKIGQALPDGLVEGVKKNSGQATGVVGDLADKILEITKDPKHFDQHSPSKATEEIMKNNLLGFVNGIKNNRAEVMNSLDSFLNGMLERMETFTNRWRSAINDMFDDMAFGWKNADFRSNGSYSYNRLSMGQIQRFAQGGFPEDGFFYANHNELVGQFSNGKTAVANNEQIIEGIAGGVAVANEEQNALLREQNRLLREQNYLIQQGSTIDVSTIASAFNRKNQRDGKVTVPVSF